MIEHCEHTWWYHSSNCGVERVSFPPQLDDGIIITKRVNNIDRYCIIFSIVRRYLSGDGFTEADHKTRHCTIQIIPVKRAFPRDTLLHSFVSIRSSVIVKFSPGGSLPRSSRRRRRREEFRVDPFRFVDREIAWKAMIVHSKPVEIGGGSVLRGEWWRIRSIENFCEPNVSCCVI